MAGRSLRKQHIVAKYGVTKNVLDVAVSKGELAMTDQGWIDEGDVIEWLASKPRGPRVTAALAEVGREPAGRTSGEPIMAAVEPDDDRPAHGGDLVAADLLESLTEVHIPIAAIAQAERVAAINKTQVSKVALDEKQMKTMAEAGRLADVREVEQLVNQSYIDITNIIKSLALQIGSDIARKRKIPAKHVKLVLNDAQIYLVEQLTEMARALADRAEQFRLDRTAEVRRRNRN